MDHKFKLCSRIAEALGPEIDISPARHRQRPLQPLSQKAQRAIPRGRPPHCYPRGNDRHPRAAR
jgi:hypothetical protein